MTFYEWENDGFDLGFFFLVALMTGSLWSLLRETMTDTKPPKKF